MGGVGCGLYTWMKTVCETFYGKVDKFTDFLKWLLFPLIGVQRFFAS